MEARLGRELRQLDEPGRGATTSILLVVRSVPPAQHCLADGGPQAPQRVDVPSRHRRQPLPVAQLELAVSIASIRGIRLEDVTAVEGCRRSQDGDGGHFLLKMKSESHRAVRRHRLAPEHYLSAQESCHGVRHDEVVDDAPGGHDRAGRRRPPGRRKVLAGGAVEEPRVLHRDIP
eukprot:10201490-Lingulodinium_polyedra.AAC.1